MDENFDIEKIFEKYKNKIYGLALSLSHNEKDAEDIVQNTFIKIIGNLRYFRGDSSLSTWIYKIAYNEALMVLRKKYRQFRSLSSLGRQEKKIPSTLFISWAKLADRQLLDDELKERLELAIRQLPLKYRMAFLLHSVNDLPLKDTANILRLKENSLKTLIHRGYLKLREEINNYLKDKLPAGQEKIGRNCRVLNKFVYDYAAGKFDNKRQNIFDRHIDDCAACKSFLNTYVQAIRITKALDCEDIPIELKEKIKTFIQGKNV